MERRTFFRAGVAAGLASLTSPRAALAVDLPVRRAGPLRLDSNENPAGLAAAARQAVIDGLPEANRYPFSARGPLIEAIAGRHGVAPSEVILGNGSTEILRVAVATGCGPTGTLVVADPTFEDITDYARAFPWTVRRVPLTPAHAHDLDAMQAAAAGAAGPVAVYLCNPNNPTSTLTDCDAIAAWIDRAPATTFFVIDEAYFEFVDDRSYRSFDRVAVARPNVLVVRTFSKIFGMAGMRCGYGIAHDSTIARLDRHITQLSPNHLAQVAALASLRDDALIARGRETNRRGREILLHTLDELGLDYLPSQTNFVMHRITGDLGVYRQRMRERGAWVGRPFPPMLDHNRVSIGLPAEMEEFAGILRDFRTRNWI